MFRGIPLPLAPFLRKVFSQKKRLRAFLYFQAGFSFCKEQEYQMFVSNPQPINQSHPEKKKLMDFLLKIRVFTPLVPKKLPSANGNEITLTKKSQHFFPQCFVTLRGQRATIGQGHIPNETRYKKRRVHWRIVIGFPGILPSVANHRDEWHFLTSNHHGYKLHDFFCCPFNCRIQPHHKFRKMLGSIVTKVKWHHVYQGPPVIGSTKQNRCTYSLALHMHMSLLQLFYAIYEI